MSAIAIAPALGSRPLAQSRMRGALRPTNLSTMNRLNAAPRPTPLKRSIVYSSDEENIAPSFSKLDSTKRKRGSEDDNQLFESPKAVKTNHTSSASEANKTVEIPTARKMSVAIGKPAGRAPLAKSTKAFGRRSKRVPLGRLAQAPAPSTKSLTPHSTRQPANWFFDIHVDTPDEEASNTMQHFAGRLDISDDDEAKAKADDRGKENIPPHELGIAMPPAAQPLMSTSRHGKNMMAPSRSPLGELKASDYYPADLKGVLNAVVIDEESATPNDDPQNTLSKEPTVSPDFTNTEAEPTLVAESDSIIKTTPI
ncbi:hypothetical protein PISL3812_04542 [Talaromyces islandicus]|uniref:Uncharacterized protein n=1 Tax=Talaromyces islandicus TaxID=28573 RepID=A0A0U1LVT2_TALIS|nr:hypothetical protein PISL3812_04542 [Talaromyces islandicus]